MSGDKPMSWTVFQTLAALWSTALVLPEMEREIRIEAILWRTRRNYK